MRSRAPQRAKPAKAAAPPRPRTSPPTDRRRPSRRPATRPTPPPASSSPMAELKKSNEKLDKILQKNRPNWSPEAELQRAEVRKLVGSFLDYGELAQPRAGAALGRR